jgi:exosortase F-associated protein
MLNHNTIRRAGIVALMGLVLAVSYHWREYAWLESIMQGKGVGMKSDPLSWEGISNKILRYLVNDLAALGIIHALFGRMDYLRLGWWVMWFGLALLLPLYFVGLWLLPPAMSIALSYLHRLIMNPVLLMLLIPALYYQSLQDKQQRS